MARNPIIRGPADGGHESRVVSRSCTGDITRQRTRTGPSAFIRDAWRGSPFVALVDLRRVGGLLLIERLGDAQRPDGRHGRRSKRILWHGRLETESPPLDAKEIARRSSTWRRVSRICVSHKAHLDCRFWTREGARRKRRVRFYYRSVSSELLIDAAVPFSAPSAPLAVSRRGRGSERSRGAQGGERLPWGHAPVCSPHPPRAVRVTAPRAVPRELCRAACERPCVKACAIDEKRRMMM